MVAAISLSEMDAAILDHLRSTMAPHEHAADFTGRYSLCEPLTAADIELDDIYRDLGGEG